MFRANGTPERIDTTDLGFTIGMEEDVSACLATREVRFGPGDGVMPHTDGVTEASNTTGEPYGIDRLCDIVQSQHQKSATEMQVAVLDDLMHYIGAAAIGDGIRLVVIRHP